MGIASTSIKVLVAIIAILGGVIKYDRALLFSIPNGFIIHAMTGGKCNKIFSLKYS